MSTYQHTHVKYTCTTTRTMYTLIIMPYVFSTNVHGDITKRINETRYPLLQTLCMSLSVMYFVHIFYYTLIANTCTCTCTYMYAFVSPVRVSLVKSYLALFIYLFFQFFALESSLKSLAFEPLVHDSMRDMLAFHNIVGIVE